MALSDTQRIILSQASQRDDRLAIPPEHLPAGARQKVAAALIRQDLVSDEHASATNARDAWQIDGRTRLLRVTDAGLRAIGVAPEEGAAAAEDVPSVPDTAPTGGEDTASQNTSAAPTEPAQGAPVAEDDGNEEDDDRPRHERNGVSDDLIYGPTDEDNGGLHPATPRTALRAAAQRVLDAWDGEENQRTDLPTAIDALRAALATKAGRPPREPGAPRKPREGTKQEAVLALLRRTEGATIAQICEATHWQQHTVRGFFVGLKKKGIEVTVLERVRQVGPNKEGARGSFTIYHVAD